MGWVPANADHAIERVTVSFQLAEAVPAKLLDHAINASKLLSNGFSEVISAGLVLQQGGVQPSPIPAAAVPRVLRKMTSPTSFVDVVFSAETLLFSTSIYTRFANFSALLEESVGEALKVIAAIVNFQEVKIEYWDRFDRKADGGAARLVDPACRLIGSTFQEERESWHSHIGFFVDRQPTNRLLLNVDVDVISRGDNPTMLPEGVDAQARIHTLAARRFDFPGYSAADGAGFDAVLQILHSEVITLFSGILDLELCRAIGIERKA